MLKGIGASGAAVMLPTAVSANCSHRKSAIARAESVHSGLSIEFADADASGVDADLVRVAISNTTPRAITLHRLSPGSIRVGEQSFNFNNQLAAGAVTIDADSTRYFWLSPSSHVDLPQAKNLASGNNVMVSVVRGESRASESHLGYFA